MRRFRIVILTAVMVNLIVYRVNQIIYLIDFYILIDFTVQKQSAGYVLREACNFIKKETPTQVFSCEFSEVFKNIFFTEHLLWLLLTFP